MKARKVIFQIIPWLIVVIVLGWQVWSSYNNSDSQSKKRFLQLRPGESMSTANADFYQKLVQAKDTVVLWGKTYVLKREPEKVINLFGPDTLSIRFMPAYIEYGPKYYVMVVDRRGKLSIIIHIDPAETGFF